MLISRSLSSELPKVLSPEQCFILLDKFCAWQKFFSLDLNGNVAICDSLLLHTLLFLIYFGFCPILYGLSLFLLLHISIIVLFLALTFLLTLLLHASFLLLSSRS